MANAARTISYLEEMCKLKFFQLRNNNEHVVWKINKFNEWIGMDKKRLERMTKR